MKQFTTILLLLFTVQVSIAQKQPDKYRILFVLDASGSMYGKWQGKLKMSSAKLILSKLVDSLDQVPRVEMALRVYGHQHKQDCQDTKLEVPFQPSNSGMIKDVLTQIRPKGRTPIAYSVEQSATDFPKEDNVRNIIILITDGVEECGGDPCAISRKLQENRVVLKPFVIGLGLDKSVTQRFKCMGRFYNASSEESFQSIMRVVVSQVLDNTTVEVHLKDHLGNPSETDVAMTFSDAQTGVTWYNLIHTLNEQKKPDKFVLESAPVYDLKVHTLPPIYKRKINLKPGENNIIEVNAEQGFLKLAMNGSMYYKSLKCVVYKAGTRHLVNVQNINSTVKYLAGTYDVEVLTLPPTLLQKVEIKSKDIVERVIANPGQLVVNYLGGYEGGIYLLNHNGLDLVKRVDPADRKEIFYIQPGHYLFVLRSSGAHRTIYSFRREIIMNSNNVRKITINN